LKKALPLFLFCALCIQSRTLLAADIDPLDTRQILQDLQDIQAKQIAAVTSQQKRNIDLVFKAAANQDAALAFYEEAQMVTQFQGANRENTQFRDWKKKQEAQLKDNDFRESLRLHLFYLGLSLKKAADTKPEELAPQVADYLRVLDGADAAIRVKDSLLKTSVSEGLFAKWLGLGPELARAKDWEMNPGKSEVIAEKYLLPEWRKQKSTALITYWDGRIARENAAAGNVKIDFQEKNYATIRKPELLWKRAQEYLVLDQPNRARQEMFSLIKNYPSHPSIGSWIESLRKTLEPVP
jgi:hypothetical protein